MANSYERLKKWRIENREKYLLNKENYRRKNGVSKFGSPEHITKCSEHSKKLWETGKMDFFIGMKQPKEWTIKAMESRAKNPYPGFWVGKKRPEISGENNKMWIKDRDLIKHQEERNNPRYKEWRLNVFKKDGYKCFWCGESKQIKADHILQWSKYPRIRYDINNGQTLCNFCHKVKTLSEIKGTNQLIFSY